MSVVVEGRTQADTARLYEGSPSWVSKLVTRYRLGGDAAFQPRSRRPHTSPRVLDPATVALITDLRTALTNRGLDNEPHTIAWHLDQHHGVVVSVATIWRRPHRSLKRATPAATYTLLPKAVPGESEIEGHYRIRHDTVGDTGTVTLRHGGTLHHIGIGRTHARTHIIMLIDDLDIRVVNPATGELIRQLTLDPNRNYQPQDHQHKKTPEP